MKRFVFSRQGQLMYLIVIGSMMILSCGLGLFSLISRPSNLASIIFIDGYSGFKH